MRGPLATLLLLGVIVVAGCDNDSPSAPSQTLSLTGTWRGTITVAGASAQMTWALTQTNAAVSGPATVTLSNGIVLLNGTVSGSFANPVLTYTMTVPPGGVPLLPVCTGQVGGTMTATSPNVLTGTYRVTSSTCETGITDGTFTMNRL